MLSLQDYSHFNTVIDLLLTNNCKRVSNSGIINYCVADHKFIYAICNLSIRSTKPVVKYVQNFKIVTKNGNDFKHELENAH